MLSGMRNRRRVEHPRGALRDSTMELAGFDRLLSAERRPEFRALGDVARPLDSPHQAGEFLVLREYQRDIARPTGGTVGGEWLAGGRTLQHHRLVVIRRRVGSGKNGPSAHRVALESDIVLVDKG